MKIALINSSPRKENSLELVNHIICEFKDITFEIINLSEIKYNFCVACDNCKDGKCLQKDDLNYIMEKITGCEGILMISPVYFGNMSAQLKAFIDRTRPLRRNGFMLLNGWAASSRPNSKCGVAKVRSTHFSGAVFCDSRCPL